MEQTLLVKPRKMNGMVLIIITSIIGILLRGAGFIGDLVDVIKGIINIFTSELEFEAFSLVTFWLDAFAMPIFALMEVLPFILLIVYACFCFRKSKGTVLLPIAFGTFGLSALVHFVKNAINLLVTLIEGSEHIQYMFEVYVPVILEELAYIFSYLVVVVACVLAIVAAIKGFTNKTLAIASSVIGIGGYGLFALTKVISCIVYVVNCLNVIEAYKDTYVSMGGFYENIGKTMIEQHENQMWSYVGSTVMALVVCFGLMLFFVAMLILALKNYIPEKIPMSEDKLDKLVTTKPRAALGILKMRYECGKISEEEYNARVAEISPIE